MSLLLICFDTLDTFGKDPEQLNNLEGAFQLVLGKYNIDDIRKAFTVYLQRNTVMPKPADIASLIDRRGKSPLKESDIIRISKKEGAERTDTDWQDLREWESQRNQEWDTPEKQIELHAEIAQLRKRIATLEAENLKAWNAAKMVRQVESKPFAAGMSKEQKIQNTVDYLKANGAPQSEINAFFESLN